MRDQGLGIGSLGFYVCPRREDTFSLAAGSHPRPVLQASGRILLKKPQIKHILRTLVRPTIGFPLSTRPIRPGRGFGLKGFIGSWLFQASCFCADLANPVLAQIQVDSSLASFRCWNVVCLNQLASFITSFPLFGWRHSLEPSTLNPKRPSCLSPKS